MIKKMFGTAAVVLTALFLFGTSASAQYYQPNGLQYVTGFTPSAPGTWLGLTSTSPCSASLVAQYAVVADLYASASATNEVARCTLSGSAYYWRPQRSDFAANIATSGGTVTFACGVNATHNFLSGTLLSAQTVVMSTANCWPGAQASFANNATLGAFTMTVTGLVGGAADVLGLGARGTYLYDGAVWRKF